MFKDARLQERLFDQIHAGEFNMEDDFRTRRSRFSYLER